MALVGLMMKAKKISRRHGDTEENQRQFSLNFLRASVRDGFGGLLFILDAAVEIAKSLHGGSGGPGGPRRIAGENRFL
jgi:hypothetical protein